ncbi:MAG: hypothetical protein EBT06_10480 [Gammaproteobacteria bacterium]|nr:hypothetical protein [Gammaproteobacteria bacterium]
MSSTSAPFGLRPAFHPSGLDRAQALAGGITSGLAVNILKGQPVTYTTAATVGSTGAANGTIIPAATPGNSAATAAYSVAGAFAGVEWTDTTGRRRVSNYWPSGTAYVVGSCIAYFYNDINIVYEIQADGSLSQTAIGNEYNFSNITAGSSTTGLSQATLATASAQTNGTQGQMRVVDIAPYVDNAWGDSYTVVRVVLPYTQFFGAFTAVV